jgi:hypothetical protein
LRRRRLVVLCALIAVMAPGTGLVVRPWIRVYTGAAPPEQFYRALSTPPDTAGHDVLAVGHNAGNNAATAAAALDHGADVIEIDVITVNGELAAGRANGWRWLEEALFQGDTLAEAWDHADRARMIQLDLQENDQRLLDSLVAFLRHTPLDRPVLVSTRDAAAIRYLRPRVPRAVTLLFSVPFPDAVSRLETDTRLREALGGITVFEGLVDAELVAWAHERRLRVLAWTVDDERRLKQLLSLRVDGITTNNLAVIGALSD